MIRGLAVAAVLATLAGSVDAEPVLERPPMGRGRFGADADDPSGASGGPLALALEVSGVGIVGDETFTTVPELGLVDGGESELVVLRLGVMGESSCRPLAFVVRADLAELDRISARGARDRPLAAIDKILDDASVWWTPHIAATIVVGRQPVPFSRWRQLDSALVHGGAVPFAVERLAPARRWGAAVLGDLGAMAYAGGLYLDADWAEDRLPAANRDDGVLDYADPSAAGTVAVAGHFAWTPRAPMGRGLLATPSADPWFRTFRWGAGAGVLVRPRGDGRGLRFDASLDGSLTWRRLAGVLELIVGTEPDLVDVTAVAELSVMPADRAVLYARGEYETCAATGTATDCAAGIRFPSDRSDRWYTFAAGFALFATDDRRNKLTLHTWLRRDGRGGPRGDGALVQVQASL